MICPACQAQVAGADDCCPACGWKFNLELVEKTPMVKSVQRPKNQAEIDLGIAIDRTGSSLRFQQGILLTIRIVLDFLSAKASKVVCYLQSHGDLDEGMDMILHTDAGSPGQVVADLENIIFDGGGLPPEHHLDAIENLVKTVPWISDPGRARGAIIACMTADAKPARSGITARELGEEIKGLGILLYLLCEPTPTLVELVKAAQGMMFEITNNPDQSELQIVASQLAASITETVKSGGTVPMKVSAQE